MIAIDFGTTNTSVAVFSEGDVAPRLQSLEYADPDSYNHQVLPSSICECETLECRGKSFTYGHEALRHGIELSHNTSLLQEMKLHFDRSTIEPASLVETKHIIALREEGGVLNPVTRVQRVPIYEGDVPLQPKDFVPATAKLITEAIRRSDVNPADRNEVVIGVPASFGAVGIRRLREAAKIGAFGKNAGYEKIFLYFEPLAAARSYMNITKGNILVLDYGGGTLDITVMNIKEPGQFDKAQKVFSGFPEGGSAMDRRILDYCLSKGGNGAREWFQRQSMATKLRIKRNVEKAKIQLSTQDNSSVEFPNAAFTPVSLTAPEVSFAIQPIMTRMASKVTQTVVTAVQSIENIDFVVMSGGTSLNRVVQTNVLAMFGHLSEKQFILPNANDDSSVESCMCAVARGLALLRAEGFAPINVHDLG